MRKNTIPLTREQQKLVEDNHNLIYSFLAEYHLSFDDYYDLAAIALCKSAKNYDPNSGFTFATYAYVAMKNEINTERKYLHKKTSIPDSKLFYYQSGYFDDDEEVPLDDLLVSPTNIEDELLIKLFFTEYLETVNQKAQRILNLSVAGLSMADVAEQIPCSKQHVSAVLNKFKNALRKESLC